MTKSKSPFPPHVEAVREQTRRLIKFTGVASGIVTDIGSQIARMKTKGHEDVAASWAFLRDAQDAIDELKKQTTALVEAIGHQQLPERLDAAKVPNFTIEGVGRFTRTERYFASMIDKAAGLKWLRANGGGDLIQETVNAQSLSGFGRARLEESGKDLPAKVFKVTLIPGVSLTRIK